MPVRSNFDLIQTGIGANNKVLEDFIMGKDGSEYSINYVTPRLPEESFKDSDREENDFYADGPK